MANLTTVEIEGLFGRFDHRVDLNKDEGITIITAPNGYGKTVLLTLIRNFFSKNFFRMSHVNFKTLKFTFDDGTFVTMFAGEQADLFEGSPNKSTPFLTFIPGNIDGALEWSFRWLDDTARRSYPMFERYMPFLSRSSRDTWIDERDGRTYTAFEIIDRYSEELPRQLKKLVEVPDWLGTIIDSTECHLIETQRLLHIEDVHPRYGESRAARRRSVVEQNAEFLASRIGDVIREYANQAQKLDQSFPKRVLPRISEDAPEEEEVRDRLKSLENRRVRLVNVGLLDKSYSTQISEQDVISDSSIRNMLDVYLDDTEKKLGVFDDIYAKIDLFQEIINDHYLFKKLVIDAKHGMNITDEDNKHIGLGSLSSGEQHELVLIFDLLFKVSQHSLILIDEPELSLHVAWQKRFIANLQRIKSLRPLSVLIATHSPQIINDRWDLTVDLHHGAINESNTE